MIFRNVHHHNLTERVRKRIEEFKFLPCSKDVIIICDCGGGLSSDGVESEGAGRKRKSSIQNFA
jgi:hypothetical protein